MMIEIDPNSPEYPKVRKTADTLKNCGVIAYPTDTIYGFGCDIFCKEAIERIYKIKKKKSTGFSFIVHDLKEVAKYAIVPDSAYRMMKRALPGPFTFIFKATKLVPKQLIPNKKTVAIRIPDNPICLEITRLLGNPIISTSINISGEPHFSDPLEIEKEFGDEIDLVIDAGVLENDPSTVIDCTGDEMVVVREGKGDVGLFS